MPEDSGLGRWLSDKSESSGQGDETLRQPRQAAGASAGSDPKMTQGSQFGHFRLQRELGRGAMARVYHAVDERDGRAVALKVLTLTEDWPQDHMDEARLRLEREAEAARTLDHPDIVEVVEYGEHAGKFYLAMEYVEGVNLSVHSTEGRLLPPRLVAEMCARVGDALHFAHQRGIVHRDIKPSNIVYDPRKRRVRVMDFGVARFEDSRATRTGVILGSPSYMAPEQLDARPVTAQSDVFSLGITLFQLLTGMLPFRSDSIPGLMQKIVSDPHPPLHVIRPDLPPSLSAIIDRALEKSPELRYTTCAEMAQALRDCARGIDPALR